MIILIVWLVIFILLAVQAYEGWDKTKALVSRGEEPSLFLLLYTGFSCVFLFPPLLVFYLKMIYNEQEKLKNPPMVYAKKQEEEKDAAVLDSIEENKTVEQTTMEDNKKTDE